ncbi:MAG: hypothetical protein Q9227_002255 [Pyrenula ochraceoflavens]
MSDDRNNPPSIARRGKRDKFPRSSWEAASTAADRAKFLTGNSSTVEPNWRARQTLKAEGVPSHMTLQDVIDRYGYARLDKVVVRFHDDNLDLPRNDLDRNDPETLKKIRLYIRYLLTTNQRTRRRVERKQWMDSGALNPRPLGNAARSNTTALSDDAAGSDNAVTSPGSVSGPEPDSDSEVEMAPQTPCVSWDALVDKTLTILIVDEHGLPRSESWTCRLQYLWKWQKDQRKDAEIDWQLGYDGLLHYVRTMAKNHYWQIGHDDLRLTEIIGDNARGLPITDHLDWSVCVDEMAGKGNREILLELALEARPHSRDVSSRVRSEEPRERSIPISGVFPIRNSPGIGQSGQFRGSLSRSLRAQETPPSTTTTTTGQGTECSSGLKRQLSPSDSEEQSEKKAKIEYVEIKDETDDESQEQHQKKPKIEDMKIKDEIIDNCQSLRRSRRISKLG